MSSTPDIITEKNGVKDAAEPASFPKHPSLRGTSAIIFLTLLIACNMPDKSHIKLLDKRELLNFPSASAVEFHDNKLYVIGDDSRSMVILDKTYSILDSVSLFPGESLRIPKKEKDDLEASTFISYNGKDHLLVAGSGSKEEREVFFVFPLEDPAGYQRIASHVFWQSLRTNGLETINIEGLATMKDKLIFANRAHRRQPHNHFIIADAAILNDTARASLHVVLLELENEEEIVKGVSGLTYIPSLDMLLFTASVEDTESTIDDGNIGDSFLGWINDFSAKAKEKKITADELVNLPAIHPDFKGEKIESVCVESVGETLTLHLVADNDDGTSTLFKLTVKP